MPLEVSSRSPCSSTSWCSPPAPRNGRTTATCDSRGRPARRRGPASDRLWPARGRRPRPVAPPARGRARDPALTRPRNVVCRPQQVFRRVHPADRRRHRGPRQLARRGVTPAPEQTADARARVRADGLVIRVPADAQQRGLVQEVERHPSATRGPQGARTQRDVGDDAPSEPVRLGRKRAGSHRAAADAEARGEAGGDLPAADRSFAAADTPR